jgi:hypothetical protein
MTIVFTQGSDGVYLTNDEITELVGPYVHILLNEFEIKKLEMNNSQTISILRREYSTNRLVKLPKLDSKLRTGLELNEDEFKIENFDFCLKNEEYLEISTKKILCRKKDGNLLIFDEIDNLITDIQTNVLCRIDQNTNLSVEKVHQIVVDLDDNKRNYQTQKSDSNAKYPKAHMLKFKYQMFIKITNFLNQQKQSRTEMDVQIILVSCVVTLVILVIVYCGLRWLRSNLTTTVTEKPEKKSEATSSEEEKEAETNASENKSEEEESGASDELEDTEEET